MNFKLLMRNKGFLFFLIIIPILAVVMLNLRQSDEASQEYDGNAIQELKHENQQITSVSNVKMCIKVYDCSNSDFSDYILKELTKTGAYEVFRYKSDVITVEEAQVKALYSANHNTLGAILYIPKEFNQSILSGSESKMLVFEGNKDGRIPLLKNNINTFLKSLYRYSNLTGGDKNETKGLLEKSVAGEIIGEVQEVSGSNSTPLTAKQKGQSVNISVSITFLTVGFLFSGVFIAATIIEERKNNVYMRFVLAKDSLANYGLAKMFMIFVNVFMQTGIIAICTKLFVKSDFGIPFGGYLLLVFCLGIVFNLLSVVIGVLTNNVLTSNYIVYLVWTISCLLAGLFFSLEGASTWWKRASLLMPQRWGVKTAEMLMVGNTQAYGTFLMVMFGFVIVISSVGLLGIQWIRKEE